MYDRVESDAVRERIDHELSKCGVAVAKPADVPLDNDRHEQIGTEPTADASQVGLVARTTGPGLLDGDRVIRRARVVVYVARQDDAAVTANAGEDK